MKRDSKLSSVLHVLLHMVNSDHPFTSETLAAYLDTNPVVVRRTLAGLRRMGYVDSSKGHGGGWFLTCDLASVSLLDIYRAVDEPVVFAMGNRNEMPGCLIEQAVNTALDSAMRDAEALLMERLSHITLAQLAADFGERMKADPANRANAIRHMPNHQH